MFRICSLGILPIKCLSSGGRDVDNPGPVKGLNDVDEVVEMGSVTPVRAACS